jgi:hypothetical protein
LKYTYIKIANHYIISCKKSCHSFLLCLQIFRFPYSFTIVNCYMSFDIRHQTFTSHEVTKLFWFQDMLFYGHKKQSNYHGFVASTLFSFCSPYTNFNSCIFNSSVISVLFCLFNYFLIFTNCKDICICICIHIHILQYWFTGNKAFWVTLLYSVGSSILLLWVWKL